MSILHRTLESANARWLSSRSKIGQAKYRRIYFYHVQKAGGSSIRRAFYNLSTARKQVGQVFHSNDVRRAILDKRVYVSHHQGLIDQGYYFFASSHLPMSALTLPPKTFTFTCLRDPIKRFLSRYRELLYFSEYEPDKFHLNVVKDWFSSDFMTMIDAVPDEELLFQLRMFSEGLDVDEAVTNVQSLSYYFLTSKINQGMQYLINHLDLPLEVYHNRKTKYDYRPTVKEMKVLQDRLRPEINMYKRLKEIYESKMLASSSSV